MPGLTAPSDYSREPPRHPSLIINAKATFFFLNFHFISILYTFVMICFSLLIFPTFVKDSVVFGGARNRSMLSLRGRPWFHLM